MKRYYFCLLFIFSCIFATGQNNYVTGLVYDSAKYYSTPLIDVDSLAPRATNDEHQQVLASSCYLETPSPMNQGSQPSCTGCAVGYAAASILVYQKYGDWTLSTMSPSFVYNQAKVSSDCSKGASFSNAFSLLHDKGICTIEIMPYDASSCSALPSASVLHQAAYNTMSYGRVNEKSVTDICSLLSAGFPVVVGIYTTSSFHSMWNSNGMWQNNVRSNDDKYHACCVIGYDNVNRLFKVQNSWGSTGGDGGFFWVTYDLVSGGVFNEAYVLYDLNPAVDISLQGPSLFCDTAVYSLENVPSGATVQWIVTPTTRVKKAATIVRGQGTSQVTLKRGFTLGGIKADTLVRDTSIRVASLAAVNLRRPYSGNGSITAIVTFGGESYSVSADFTIPSQTATEKPVVNGAYNSLWYVNISHTLSVRNCDSVPNDKLLWEVHLPGQSTPLTQTGRSVTFTPKSTGTVTVIIANMESCSASNVDTLTYRVIDRPSIRFVNPATAASSLDVAVSSTEDEQVTTVVPYDGEYTLELWSELLGCVRRVEANEPTTQISLSGLPTGIYFIKLIINDELVTTKQLIVR